MLKNDPALFNLSDFSERCKARSLSEDSEEAIDLKAAIEYYKRLYSKIENPEEGVYIAREWCHIIEKDGYEQFPFEEELREDVKKGKIKKFYPSYGVCDDYKQVLKKNKKLKDPKRTFILFLREIKKEDRPEDGGWRWHKWGLYIGKQKPTCEYLYNEPKIESVFVYEIWEKKYENP